MERRLPALGFKMKQQRVDLLFIDGDRSYEGVKQNWEQYSALVRPRGMVVFHDIGSAWVNSCIFILQPSGSVALGIYGAPWPGPQG